MLSSTFLTDNFTFVEREFWEYLTCGSRNMASYACIAVPAAVTASWPSRANEGAGVRVVEGAARDRWGLRRQSGWTSRVS